MFSHFISTTAMSQPAFYPDSQISKLMLWGGDPWFFPLFFPNIFHIISPSIQLPFLCPFLLCSHLGNQLSHEPLEFLTVQSLRSWGDCLFFFFPFLFLLICAQHESSTYCIPGTLPKPSQNLYSCNTHPVIPRERPLLPEWKILSDQEVKEIFQGTE